MESENSFEKEPIYVGAPNPEDARDIRKVFYETWLDTYPNEEAGITKEDVEDQFKDRISPESIKKFEEALENNAVEENKNFFVAKFNGEVAGVCKIALLEDRNNLNAIYVLPEYQGKGIGKALFMRAQELFNKEKDTFVQVASYNEDAIGFYEEMGFLDTGNRFTEEKYRMKSGANISQMEMVIRVREGN